MSAAKTKAQDIIDNNAVGKMRPCPICLLEHKSYTDTYVAVFSKSWCPYCKATKETLSGLGAKAYILELDQVGKIFLYREDMGTDAE